MCSNYQIHYSVPKSSVVAGAMETAPEFKVPLPAFVKQAASGKTIGILCRDSSNIAEKFLKIRVIHQLLYAMGNVDYADSQRQASLSLEVRIYVACRFMNVCREITQYLFEFLVSGSIVSFC